ncbi:Gfo/Idh/MocA family oxidoreductase [Rhizobium sp. BK376]|uniref:Gfo/Idh/MocA family protein n=1 Tax=Rhizobium sp. BK376 TaxID=2512149 RepID=UPI001042C04F|nr:Gfo/Idh/MocA family oxidoreductase [Rhizobium sp. BK376]TCR83856.1 putative dehydrogenase [Rhizobium sp. BK376]
MSDIKKVAVIGLGIGRSHIVEGYLPHPDRFEVAILCDLNDERLNAVGNEFGIKGRTKDFAEVLRMPDIDIIDICTPPGSHFELILQALASGKHVVCEKPLVGSLADVDAVMEAEKTARGVLMPIFQYRYGDGVQKAKRIIDAGIAGKPYVATSETHWLRTAEYYAVPWRGKWATELGGVLMTHSIHLHDMLTYLMGPIAGLFGRVATRVNDIEVEDCASASLLMENGALATISATLGSTSQISRLRLCFENVLFESNHEPYSPGQDPWTIVPANDEIAARIDAVLKDWTPVPIRFETQMTLFHDALVSSGPLPVTTVDARRALELVTAFYESSETRTEVRFPVGPESRKYKSWRPA